MRLNVYAEEITAETELVTKTVTDEEFGTRTFYGLRTYLASPDVLHHSADDDDRSAITFWVKWTAKDGTDLNPVMDMLMGLEGRLEQVAFKLNSSKESNGS